VAVLELNNFHYLLIAFIWQIATAPTIIMTMAQPQTTPTAVRSGQDNSDSVSDTKTREAEIKTRKESIDRWNTAQIAFIVLAAIAAAGLVVTGIVLTSKGNKLSTVQDELSTIKDQNAAADSRAKSLLIVEAQNNAAQANEKAKQLEKQTVELKNQNLEIERRINPRFLTTAEQQMILNGITPFRGHQIIITRLGDGEAGPLSRAEKNQTGGAEQK
jgi:outer membrane murein-binding lipoprotein Lpp